MGGEGKDVGVRAGRAGGERERDAGEEDHEDGGGGGGSGGVGRGGERESTLLPEEGTVHLRSSSLAPVRARRDEEEGSSLGEADRANQPRNRYQAHSKKKVCIRASDAAQ